MSSIIRWCMAGILVGYAFGAAAQTQEQVPPGLVHAQQSEEKARAEMPPPLPPRSGGASPEELKREAAELSRLAQQIPGEVEALNHGVLNKGLDGELKQIEKLSKKLRSAVRR